VGDDLGSEGSGGGLVTVETVRWVSFYPYGNGRQLWESGWVGK